jgi:putative serine protease PepD
MGTQSRNFGPQAGAALVAGAIGLALAAGLLGGLIASVARSSGSCSAVTIARNGLPSVVTISASGTGAAGTGSGEVIRDDGFILTNDHVISVAADGGSVNVLFDDGHRVPATIVGRDPATDLAVLKVDGEPPLPVLPVGTSASLEVGQPVVALGAPLGLSSTVTAGIVSALDRMIEVPAANGQTALLVAAIQTDASINPGNSGGALLDCSGRLVGVNTAGATVPNPGGQASPGSIGLNFAIPVDLALAVADELIETGHAAHSYIGLQAVPLPTGLAGRTGVDHGLFITAVSPGGPAATAGLEPGDIITQLEQRPAERTTQLTAVELTRRAGEMITVEYKRDDQVGTATVVLVDQPPPP